MRRGLSRSRGERHLCAGERCSWKIGKGLAGRREGLGFVEWMEGMELL